MTKLTRKNTWLAVLLTASMLLLLLVPVGLMGRAANIKTADVTVRQAADKNWYTYTKKDNKRVNYTGVAQNGLGWWRTENGKVNFKATGVFQNDYGWWRVENGKVNFAAQGIYQNAYGWWKTTDGNVNFRDTGVFQNENGWWYVRNSKVDFSFTGIGTNKNGQWHIENGRVNFGFTGSALYNGSYYLIKNGKATKTVQPSSEPDKDISTAYDELNKFRTSAGVWYWAQNNKDKVVFNQSGKTTLTALTRDEELEKVAELRTKEIAQSFSHTRPDGSECFTAYPAGLKASGENLVMEYTGSAAFATSLLQEEGENYAGQGHRRLMLDEEFNCVGIACYKAPDGNYYWVQAFGRR